MVETADDHDRARDGDYDRAHAAGFEAGGIAAKLASHDRHLKTINGSVGDVAVKLGEVAGQFAEVQMALQRLADQADARDATAIALAEALKEKVETDRAATEVDRSAQVNRWTPIQVVTGIVLGAASLALAVWAVVSASR